MKRIALLALIATTLSATADPGFRAWAESQMDARGNPIINNHVALRDVANRRPIIGYTYTTNQIPRPAYEFEVAIRDTILAHTNSLAWLSGLSGTERYKAIRDFGKTVYQSVPTAQAKADAIQEWLQIKSDDDKAKELGGGISSTEALQEFSVIITKTPIEGPSPSQVNGWVVPETADVGRLLK